MPALPTVSLKVTGDASGLNRALKGAEVQTSLSAARIDDEAGLLVKRLNRRFGAAHIGMDILRGAGIGSGWHLAEKAAEMIAEHWKKAAESAKELAEISDKKTSAVFETLRGRRDDKQQLDWLKMERSRMEMSLFKMGQSEKYGGLTDQQKVEKEQLGTNLQEKGNEITKQEKVISDAAAKEFTAAAAEAGKKVAEQARVLAEKDQKKFEATKKSDANEKKTDAMLDRETQLKPLTDRFTRMGLLSGTMSSGLGDTTSKQQLHVLEQMLTLMRGGSGGLPGTYMHG